MLPPWLIVPIAYGVYRWLTDDNNSSSNSAPPLPPILNRICLAGRTGSGKSSTANALLGYYGFEVGAQNGSTTTSKELTYRSGYTIVDTPGLLDSSNYEYIVLNEMKKSKIIIYVTNGQLYQAEINFLDKFRSNYLQSSQKIFLYVNQQDVREQTMPSSQREREKQSIINQVSSWLASSNIAFGSAAPVKNNQILTPDISELNNLLSNTF